MDLVKRYIIRRFRHPKRYIIYRSFVKLIILLAQDIFLTTKATKYFMKESVIQKPTKTEGK